MNPMQQFADYAVAFEQAFATDEWTSLGGHLSPAVVYETFGAFPLAGRASGRDAAVARLRSLVDRMDRRFDARVPEVIEGPEERDGGMWMRFRLLLKRDGVPDLEIKGEHVTFHGPDGIWRIEEYVPVITCQRVAWYLDEYGPRLKPAAVSASRPRADLGVDVADHSHGLVETGRARSAEELVRAYAAAKSRQDVVAALALCSDDFRLETVALGVSAEGKEAVDRQLRLFFQAFPDYAVSLEGLATGADGVAAWGRARLTLQGHMLGLDGACPTAELPIFCVFTVSGSRLRSERFFFDLASLCEQAGIPIALMRAAAGTEAPGNSSRLVLEPAHQPSGSPGVPARP